MNPCVTEQGLRVNFIESKLLYGPSFLKPYKLWPMTHSLKYYGYNVLQNHITNNFEFGIPCTLFSSTIISQIYEHFIHYINVTFIFFISIQQYVKIVNGVVCETLGVYNTYSLCHMSRYLWFCATWTIIGVFNEIYCIFNLYIVFFYHAWSINQEV